jgi:hypothetical protein
MLTTPVRVTVWTVVGAVVATDARDVIFGISMVGLVIVFCVVLPCVWSKRRYRRLAAWKVLQAILSICRPGK